MRLRELSTALIVAFSSVALVLGALSISLVEFIPEATATPTFAVPASPVPVTATASLLPTNTSDPNIATQTFTVTSTVVAPIVCQPPTGWIAITVQINDTLDSLATRYREDRNILKNGNCLVSDNLIPGTLFYVPPAATSTISICSAGAVGWVKSYVVVKGDTMYAISANHYTSVALLKQVNCRSSEQIFIGEILWVPNVATRTPFPTAMPGTTVPPYPTDPLTQTALPFTDTPVPSSTPLPTATPSPIPTLTTSPTAFATP
jgi:LysM repeat protein